MITGQIIGTVRQHGLVVLRDKWRQLQASESYNVLRHWVKDRVVGEISVAVAAGGTRVAVAAGALRQRLMRNQSADSAAGQGDSESSKQEGGSQDDGVGRHWESLQQLTRAREKPEVEFYDTARYVCSS